MLDGQVEFCTISGLVATYEGSSKSLAPKIMLSRAPLDTVLPKMMFPSGLPTW